MEKDKAVEQYLTLTPTESNQDGNVPREMEETSGLSLGEEGTNRPSIIFSSSSRQETQNIPSSSKTDSETGETSVGSSRICHLPRPNIPSNLVQSSHESSEPMEVLTAETNTSVSKGRFKIPPEVKSDVRPVITVSEEKDLSVDEVVVKTPAIQLTIDASPRTELNYWTFSKNLMSRTVSTSEDTLPDHGVYVSEESSMSSPDVSHSISNLKLAESVDSGLTLPLVESPSPPPPPLPPPPSSKRKLSDPVWSNEDCHGSASKKGRISPVEISNESTQMTDEELQENSVASGSAEAVGTETDKGPLIEFPEDLEGYSKSEQGSTKRTIMTLREVEDITDASSDAKRIKPSN